MKRFTKLMALLLAVLMMLAAAACHPKDEIALTVGDVKLTSAMYMVCLVNADGEARQRVTENDTTGTASQDYYSQSIDGVKFEDWVKNRAIELLTEYAAYETLLNEGKFTLSDEKRAEAEETAQYYWDTYGYSELFIPNGVNYNTYEKSVVLSYMADEYFLSIYGADGTSPIAAGDVEKALSENFEVVRRIDGQVDSSMTEDQQNELKAEFEGYEKALNDNSKTFEEIYKEYYQIEDEAVTSGGSTSSGASSVSSSASSASDSSSSTSSEESKPKDEYATVVGGKNTPNPDSNFAAIKAMKVGEIKLFEPSDTSTSYSLVVRGDITSDPYYDENLDSTVRHILKDEEFETTLDEYIKGLQVEKNDYAIYRFKVKNIKYPSTTA